MEDRTVYRDPAAPGLPPGFFVASRVAVDGVDLDFVSGSLVAGDEPTSRQDWAVVCVVRGLFEAPARAVPIEIATGSGTYLGHALVAALRTTDGAEIRTGLTAIAEGELHRV